MDCRSCSRPNDAEALFCEHCGSPLNASQTTATEGNKRSYVYWAALVIVMAVAAAAGYYKFILPNGVAAEVNGEVITIAEVDAVIHGATGGQQVPEEMTGRMRFRVISDLIAEHVAWQEARKAGTTVPAADVDAAYAKEAGADRAAFDRQVKAQHGSVRAYREVLERRLGIRKYLAGTVAAGIADPAAADARIGAWLQEATARSSIRVSLEAPASKAGCSCCSSGGPSGGKGGGEQASPKAKQAEQAALAYWRTKGGDGEVQTKLTDFGCHFQVDIVKGNRIARSLRYQDGVITEL